MVDAAFLKLMAPFQYHYRFVSLGIMAEKVAMVIAARWHGGDSAALCILTGMGLLFFVATGAYHASMRVPRWLGLSARLSTFLVSLVAALKGRLSINDHILNFILLTVFAAVVILYLFVFNLFTIAAKLRNTAHLLAAVNRAESYALPPNRGGHGEVEWLSPEAKLSRYDTLVLSPTQFECVIAYCSTASWFKSWVAFGVKYRPVIENMKELVLVGRGITAFGVGIGKLTNLEILDVHQNTELTNLPADIGHLSKLTKLDASYTKIESEKQ
jgi:hypothetical protein